MNYKIVIPSYNRIQQVEYRTLNFLFKHNINQSKIYIFAHPLSYDEYVEVLKPKYPRSGN